MLGGIKISQICEEPPSIHVVCGLGGGFINAVLTKDKCNSYAFDHTGPLYSGVPHLVMTLVEKGKKKREIKWITAKSWRDEVLALYFF